MSLFSHLRIYAVYTRPDHPLEQKPVLIREGFNLFAFLFGFFWALYHRLWMPLVMIFLFNVAIVYAGKVHVLTPQSIAMIQMGFQFFVGLQASTWRQAKLVRRKKYVLSDISAADTQMRAEQRYFERLVAAAA